MNECLNEVRAHAPLVHCITNYVTVNDVANVIWICGSVSAHHAGELAASASDAAHLGPAVADDVTALSICDQIDGAGYGGDDLILLCEFLGEAYGFIQIGLSDRISHIGIDAPGRTAAGCQRLDL